LKCPPRRWGVEAQLLNDGELLIGQRFDTGALALHWAKVEREAHEQAVWRPAADALKS